MNKSDKLVLQEAAARALVLETAGTVRDTISFMLQAQPQEDGEPCVFKASSIIEDLQQAIDHWKETSQLARDYFKSPENVDGKA